MAKVESCYDCRHFMLCHVRRSVWTAISEVACVADASKFDDSRIFKEAFQLVRRECVKFEPDPDIKTAGELAPAGGKEENPEDTCATG